MKKALFVALFFLGMALFANPVSAKKIYVNAKVDSKCRAKPGSLVVPSKKSGKSFRILRLTKGRKCVTGGVPDIKGFVIKKGSRVVYRYSKWRNKRKKETPVSIGKLVLSSGRYRVYVSGGRGARLKLSLHLR